MEHPSDAPLAMPILGLLGGKGKTAAMGPARSAAASSPQEHALLFVPRLGVIVGCDADSQAMAATAMAIDPETAPPVAGEAGEQQQNHQTDYVAHERKIMSER